MENHRGLSVLFTGPSTESKSSLDERSALLFGIWHYIRNDFNREKSIFVTF